MSSVVARAIRAGYREREVLRGVDLVAHAGELVALIGPNGAGKSTLLRVVDDARAVARALDDIGATDLADRRIDRVSGGERQRAVLAMALAQEAGVLLLDEPTAHLDPAHQRATLDRVATLARLRGLAVVAVLHDLNLAAAFASRVVLLADGTVVRDGGVGDVITSELVGRVFGPGLRVVAYDGQPIVIPEPASVEERHARAG